MTSTTSTNVIKLTPDPKSVPLTKLDNSSNQVVQLATEIISNVEYKYISLDNILKYIGVTILLVETIDEFSGKDNSDFITSILKHISELVPIKDLDKQTVNTIIEKLTPCLIQIITSVKKTVLKVGSVVEDEIEDEIAVNIKDKQWFTCFRCCSKTKKNTLIVKS